MNTLAFFLLLFLSFQIYYSFLKIEIYKITEDTKWFLIGFVFIGTLTGSTVVSLDIGLVTNPIEKYSGLQYSDSYGSFVVLFGIVLTAISSFMIPILSRENKIVKEDTFLSESTGRIIFEIVGFVSGVLGILSFILDYF